jgi:vacuolar-type H+-ATPase subunit I/STV1
MATCYLRDLKVKKVSFVSRGANRKQFFLAKSADFDTSVNNNINSGGTTTVRPEIKSKVAEILKAERNIEKVVALLKEDATLKATDAEVTEVRDFLAMMPAPDTSALEKAQAEAKKAEEEKQKLETRLNKIEEDQHRAEIKRWVDDECAHLNMNVDEAVNQILKAEKVDKDTAETLRKSFKSTSDALKSSVILREVGRDGEAMDPLCNNLVAEVTKAAGDIRKSASGQKQSEIIVDAIKSVGAHRYEQYRKEFNHRAKTA